MSEESTEVRKDLRLELKIKNNILWKAIHREHGSVAAFCRAFPEMKTKQVVLGLLLRFKISPFKTRWRKVSGKIERETTDQYRSICFMLERTLKIPAEDLFPKHLYEQLTGKETEPVAEISSFSALPNAVRQEIRRLPVPIEQNPEFETERSLLRSRVNKVLRSLKYREREILKLRLGLGGGYSYTLDEVADIFKVSRESIRQIEAEALRKLNRPDLKAILAPFTQSLIG